MILPSDTPKITIPIDTHQYNLPIDTYDKVPIDTYDKVRNIVPIDTPHNILPIDVVHNHTSDTVQNFVPIDNVDSATDNKSHSSINYEHGYTNYIQESDVNLHTLVIEQLGYDYYRKVWENVHEACSLEYAIEQYENQISYTNTVDNQIYITNHDTLNHSTDQPEILAIHTTAKQLKHPNTNLIQLTECHEHFNNWKNTDTIHETRNKRGVDKRNLIQIKSDLTRRNLKIFYQNVRGLRT